MEITRLAASARPGYGRSRAKRRTLRFLMLRVLVLRAVLFGVMTTMFGLARALSADPSAQLSLEQVAPPLPSWTVADHRAHPGCVSSVSWPKGKTADYVVVYRFRDDVRRMVAFADAWKMNHNDTEVDDIWVLGICPSGAARIASTAESR